MTVETTITPGPDGHTRVHDITSDVECEAYDCGFAVDRGDFTPVGFQSEEGNNFAMAENEHSLCRVTAVEPVREEEDMGHIIIADPNTNLLYTKTVIPSIKYKIQKGRQTLVTTVEAVIK